MSKYCQQPKRTAQTISALENYGLESFLLGGGGLGVIFGLTPDFFGFVGKSVIVKLHGKKKKKAKEIVCSFNDIPITCRLEMEFFSHNQK